MDTALHLITLALAGPTDAQPDPTAVTEQLWARCRPEDRIEHFRVRIDPGHIDVAVFVLAESRSAGLDTARALCARALEHSPELSRWLLAG
ncbi:hypothetical protein Lfu02_73610 [Longispora fulva]|uniref:Uncharacterized protein n=1 Tax=Longispora fulva TaxID=619741 RepID=A0A8J7G9Q0_9ACTN|nr:hypothetical protein [Longispora fulva]MBG6134274.1 hypothetical protein [Longispora fulva]GIG62989.1 hypothetical protein Lfu02_73610 [Longispora fulva]